MCRQRPKKRLRTARKDCFWKLTWMVFPLAEKSISRLTTVMRNFLLPSKNSSLAYLQVISQHISKTLKIWWRKRNSKVLSLSFSCSSKGSPNHWNSRWFSGKTGIQRFAWWHWRVYLSLWRQWRRSNACRRYSLGVSLSTLHHPINVLVKPG